jgi:hypothetical protein
LFVIGRIVVLNLVAGNTFLCGSRQVSLVAIRTLYNRFMSTLQFIPSVSCMVKRGWFPCRSGVAGRTIVGDSGSHMAWDLCRSMIFKVATVTIGGQFSVGTRNVTFGTTNGMSGGKREKAVIDNFCIPTS